MVANQTDATYGFLDIPENLPNLNWRDLFLLKDSLKWDDFAREFRLWIKTQRAWPFLCFLDMALVRPNDLKDKERGVYFLVAPKCNIASYKQFMAGFLTAGYGIARSKEFLNGIFDFSYSSNLQFLTVDSEKGLNVGGGVFNSDLSCEISEVQFSSSEAKYSLKESIDAFMKVVSNGTFRDAYNRDISTVFFVPISTRVGTSKNLAQLVVGVSNCNVDDIIKELLQKVSQFVYYYYASAHAEQQAEQLKGAYTHAAIGSIMSRNGSHNIGSHVLSALSHNVGTMPDDRVLYQYIQHRMDYIATATTEFPQWTTPTMFVAGLMKNFYSQKHLLDYISRSEGLRAYKFQERNLDDATRMNQHGTIRIFLRRFYKLDETNQGELPREHRYLTYDQYGHAWSIYYFFGEKDKMFRQKSSEGKCMRTQYEVSESGGTAKFLEYDERFTPDWRQDVRLAIPGGIVGQHAFYTIIENVIRNAAKHGWASENNLTEKDLEVYIDFGEKKATGNVVFTIGDNVSDIFGGAKKFWDDFFAAFSCSDEKSPLRYWRDFCKNSARDALVAAINMASKRGEYRSDGLPNCWCGAWEMIERGDSVSEKSDLTESQRVKMAGLLLCAYTMPLESSDDEKKDEARALESYLSEKHKNDPASEAELPLLYQFQREYILASIVRYNVSCYIGYVDGKLQILPGANIIGDIYQAIMSGGFDKVMLDDPVLRTPRNEARLRNIVKRCEIRLRLEHVNKIGKLTGYIDRAVKKVFSLKTITADDIERLGYAESQATLSENERIIRLYLQRRISDNWQYKKFLTRNMPHDAEWNLGRRLILPLHHDQQRKLAQSFIDSEGKLRKENWGLAEMKISAGYLAQRETSEIGGLDVKGNNIIVPVAMPGLCRNADNPHNCLMCRDRNRMACYESDPSCPLRKHRYHLGYRFEIAKPKDILIIFEDIDSNVANVIQNKSYEGVDFALQSKPSDGNKWHSYRLILSDGSVDDEIKRFNYRYVVLVRQTKTSDAEDATNGGSYQRFGFRFMIWDDKGDSKEKLLDIIQGGDIVKLRKVVFSAWIKRLANDCKRLANRHVKLIVNVDGNEGGRERGLVTRKDLLRTMFVECYHTALISFLKNPPESLELSDTSRNLITLLSLIKVLPEAMVPPQQDYGHGDDKGAKEYIRAQLVWYCDLLKSHLLLSVEFIDALKSIELYVKDAAGTGDAIVARKIEDIEKDFEKSIARRLFRGKQDEDDDIRRWCKELIAFLQKIDKESLNRWLDAFHGGSDRYNCPQRKDSYGHGRHSFEDNLKAIITVCSVPEEDEFNALVESLNSMFLASDVYLRKYEERIATLPEAYKHDGTNRGRKGYDSDNVESVQAIADTLLGRSLVDESNCRVIKYSRHDHSMPENGIYSEALSGSQSYLNALSRLVYASGKDKTGERYASVARLLENAFLRILIIDERVMNFVEERRSDEMRKTLIDMGIWVADVVNEGVAKASSEVKDELYQFHHPKDVSKLMDSDHSHYVDIKPGQFDILVIHQGIIDKWWERHDEARVKEILEDLRLSIPRVVVTTGRGRPENIPADEKVLPFSVIESSLFKRYPEKLIFVNTIMNLLPYGTDKTKVS